MTEDVRLSTRYLGFLFFIFFINWTGWDSIGFSFPFWLLYILIRETEKGHSNRFLVFNRTVLKENFFLILWLLMDVIYIFLYYNEPRAMRIGGYYLIGSLFFIYAIDASFSRHEVNWIIKQYIVMAIIASFLLFIQRAPVPTYTNRISVSILGHIKDPNYFSAYVMCPCLICFYRYIKGQGYLWLLLSLIIGSAILLTGSRSSFLALSLGVSCILCGMLWHRKAWKKILIVIAILNFVFIVFLPEDLVLRFCNFNSYKDGSNNLRLNIWTAALNIWKTNPLLGAGQNAVANHGVEYGARIHMMTHSTYLDVLAEFGIIGLVLFLTIPLKCLYWSYKYKNIVLLSIVLSTLSTAAIVSAQYSQYYWLNMILLCSIVNIDKNYYAFCIEKKKT